MFEPSSRYAPLETVQWTAPDGRIIQYKRRRFPPPASSLSPVSDVTVQAGERLDHIAASALGDPQAFWQICDANEAIEPLELTSRPGKILHISLPHP